WARPVATRSSGARSWAPSSPPIAWVGALLGEPASTTTTSRRIRPNVSAAWSPALPPPTTTTSVSMDAQWHGPLRCGTVLAELATDESIVRQRLRALREDRGLTLDTVAAAAGMAASTLSRLETGKRRLAVDHLVPLARALGTSVDALLAPEPPVDPRVRRRA